MQNKDTQYNWYNGLFIDTKKEYDIESAISMAEDMFTIVKEECDAYGFEIKKNNYNDILLAAVKYRDHILEIHMDLINATVDLVLDDKVNEFDTFAGLTDHYTFKIGDDGIVDERDYYYVFMEIFNHLIYGIPIWLSDLMNAVDSDIYHEPVDDRAFRSDVEQCEKINPKTEE